MVFFELILKFERLFFENILKSLVQYSAIARGIGLNYRISIPQYP